MAGKESLVSDQGVSDQSFIGIGAIATQRLLVVDAQLDVVRDHRKPRHLCLHRHRDAVIGLHPEAESIWLRAVVLVSEQHARRLLELHDGLGDGLAQRFACPNVEGNTLPTPRLDLEGHRSERLGIGVLRHTLLIEVPLDLAADDKIRIEGFHCFEHLDLLVAKSRRVLASWWLHSHEGDHLEKVVLHDVANRSDLVVERSTTFDAKSLGHGDRHGLHVVAVPDRLEHRVGEAEDHQVLHGLFAQEVVDTKDLAFIEMLVQRFVQLLGRSEITPERLPSAPSVSSARRGQVDSFV